MLKSKKNWVILVLLVITIYLCFRNFELVREIEKSNNPTAITYTDTIYKDRSEYSEVKEFSNSLKPKKLVIFSGYKEVKDTNKSILPKYPVFYDSISQILIKNDYLELTTKNTLDSTYKIRKFNIDPLQYNYNWVNNQLTYEKRFKPRLIPYIKGSYRPFNNFTDLGMGISFETKRFNYNLGVNAFYYPNLKKSLGTDVEISITYKFK